MSSSTWSNDLSGGIGFMFFIRSNKFFGNICARELLTQHDTEIHLSNIEI